MRTSHASSRSDATELTPDALAALRNELVAELEAQRAQRRENRSIADALLGQTDVESTLARTMADSAVRRCEETIDAVQSALRRMDEGGYGRCERCRSRISYERLAAIPYATNCVSCPSPPRRLG